MNTAVKDRVRARVCRVAGQIRDISGVLQADRPLEDVRLQVASAQAGPGGPGTAVRS
jgi:DNA-binding FrmR family transcriptional regulator